MAKLHKQNNKGLLRIIGGIWRGRKLCFPEVEGLRPTGDRVRETLFNWLQPVLGGSHCLDCCAGSGALGFEAASRGAAKVSMIEADRAAFSSLAESKTLLNAEQVDLFYGRVEDFLNKAKTPFDVVFLDPPYQLDLWTNIASQLTDNALLNDGARIYIEYPRRQEQPELPTSWQCLREKQAGDVKYALFEFRSGSAD